MTGAEEVKRELDPTMAENAKPPATKFRLPDASPTEPHGFEPVEMPPESVGNVLRRTREQFDQTIADVSATLNIRRVYLQALEDGHYDKLPGSAYAVGFLRSYADYLSLDSKELARRFKEEIVGHQDSTQLVFPVPATESRVPGGALILVSLVLCALAYGAWTLISKPEPQVAELVPAVPDRLQGLLDEEAAAAASAERPEGTAPNLDQGSELSANISLANGNGGADEPSVATESGQATAAEPADRSAALGLPAYEAAPLAEEPLSPVAQPGAAEAPTPVAKPVVTVEPEPQPAATEPGQPAAQTAPSLLAETTPRADPLPIPKPPSLDAQPSAPSASGTEVAALPPLVPTVYGVENGNSRITLRATQDSWIQVRSGLDDLLLTRVLRAGDTFLVPNRLGITMQTGNAGGLEVLVDGRNLGPMGPLGAVRRNVALEPDRLLGSSTSQR